MLKKMIVQEIQDLKQGGYSLNEVRDHLRARMGKHAPSMPTIRKYYNMDGVPDDLHARTAKPHAFNVEPFRSDVLEILAPDQKCHLDYPGLAAPLVGICGEQVVQASHLPVLRPHLLAPRVAHHGS